MFAFVSLLPNLTALFAYPETAVLTDASGLCSILAYVVARSLSEWGEFVESFFGGLFHVDAVVDQILFKGMLTRLRRRFYVPAQSAGVVVVLAFQTSCPAELAPSFFVADHLRS